MALSGGGGFLKEVEFDTWCKRLGLRAGSSKVIADVRSRPPTRRVGGGRSNVSGRYPSRKMGVTIQFESHRVELPFIYELEHDSSVLEYYDQPPSIPLAYEANTGKRLSVLHTPDFFVIREASAGWEECKNEEDLKKLAEMSRNRYQPDANGGWRCPPGESHANPPPVPDVCRAAGVKPTFLLNNFPTVYKQISSAYVARREAARQQRQAVPP